jgi:hypothetical protein
VTSSGPRTPAPTDLTPSSEGGVGDAPQLDLDEWCSSCDAAAQAPTRAAAWQAAAPCRALTACEALRACVDEAFAAASLDGDELETRDERDEGDVPAAGGGDVLGEGHEARADRTAPHRAGRSSGRRLAGRPGASASSSSAIDLEVEAAGSEDACIRYCDRALACGVGEVDASSERIAALRAAAEAPWFECLRTCRLERSAGRGDRLDTCLAAPSCDGFAPCLSDE